MIKIHASLAEANLTPQVKSSEMWEMGIGGDVFNSQRSPAVVSKRNKNHPVGFLNTGNSCYYNCVLQILFSVRKFTKQIAKFKIENDHREILKGSKFEQKEKYKASGVELILNLQELFGRMLKGNLSVLKAQPVLENMFYPETMEKFIDGDQKDVPEFLDYLFKALEAGFEMRNSNSDKKVAIA